MKHHSIEVLADKHLAEADLRELWRLFDKEYLHDVGEWDPEQPYGYASREGFRWTDADARRGNLASRCPRSAPIPAEPREVATARRRETRPVL